MYLRIPCFLYFKLVCLFPAWLVLKFSNLLKILAIVSGVYFKTYLSNVIWNVFSKNVSFELRLILYSCSCCTLFELCSLTLSLFKIIKPLFNCVFQSFKIPFKNKIFCLTSVEFLCRNFAFIK